MNVYKSNCWKEAIDALIEHPNYYLLMRLTRMSAARKPNYIISVLGKYLLIIPGVILFNLGMLLITGKWGHALFSESASGPWCEFIPVKKKRVTFPPISFLGYIKTNNNP